MGSQPGLRPHPEGTVEERIAAPVIGRMAGDGQHGGDDTSMIAASARMMDEAA